MDGVHDFSSDVSNLQGIEYWINLLRTSLLESLIHLWLCSKFFCFLLMFVKLLSRQETRDKSVYDGTATFLIDGSLLIYDIVYYSFPSTLIEIDDLHCPMVLYTFCLFLS